MTMTILAGSAVKAAVVVLLAVAAALALRRSSAAMRHWVLAVGIGCALVAPALALAAPAWAISLPSAAPRASSASPSSSIAAPVSKSGEVRTEATIVIDRAALQSASPRNAGVVGVLVATWLAGSTTLTSILLVGFVRLGRVAASASPIESGRWFRCAAEIARAHGIRRPILLLQSHHPALLVTWGWRRPRVLLPSAAHDWDDERMRVVLRHELAHIVRGDWAAQLVAELLRCCHWFNPLVWIACRQLRRESERACDDEVLRGGVDPADYASHLLDLARLFHARHVERRISNDARIPGMAMARPSSLEGRISAMLNARLDRRPLSRALQAATAGAFLAATLSIAGAAQARYSTFSGTVVDPTNAFLPNTTLVLTNNGSKARHEVKSDSTGRFEFVGLPPGEYTLQVGQAGFTTLNESLSIARDVTRTIELQVGSLEETIRIVAGGSGPAAPDPERAAKQQAVRRKAQERQQRANERCEGAAAGGVGGNILQPWKILDVRPVYPATASSTRTGGVVTMEAVIGTDGTVREVRVISSPHPDLDRAATDAVRQWEFTPTMLNCTPIEVRMKVTASFVAP